MRAKIAPKLFIIIIIIIIIIITIVIIIKSAIVGTRLHHGRNAQRERERERERESESETECLANGSRGEMSGARTGAGALPRPGHVPRPDSAARQSRVTASRSRPQLAGHVLHWLVTSSIGWSRPPLTGHVLYWLVTSSIGWSRPPLAGHVLHWPVTLVATSPPRPAVITSFHPVMVKSEAGGRVRASGGDGAADP